MKPPLLILVAAVVGQGAVAEAAPHPMAPFRRFAGSWACIERVEHGPRRASRFDFTVDHEVVTFTRRDRRRQGDVITSLFAYDGRNHRYVETEMAADGVWYVSTALAPSNGAFRWTDVATAAVASRWNMYLPRGRRFRIESFGTAADTKPSYRATCSLERRTVPGTTEAARMAPIRSPEPIRALRAPAATPLRVQGQGLESAHDPALDHLM